MPIRTPRGRAAAYRPVWQWPLRSPARLGATAAVVVALAVGTSVTVTSLRGPTGPREPGRTDSAAATAGEYPPAPSPPSVAPSVLPPVAALVPPTLSPGQAPVAAVQVAAGWSAAWVRHPAGITSAQWLAGLRPLTTPEYLGVLSGVDPANVPAVRVTGAPRPVRVSPHSLQVEVPTDTLTLLVLVVDTDSGWRVAGYDRV